MSGADDIRGLACGDCAMLIANGETPPELDERETATYLAAVNACSGWIPWVVCDGDNGHHDFSSARCDVCGSTLGGSRCEVAAWWTHDRPTTTTRMVTR